jgi:hypothetical protein
MIDLRALPAARPLVLLSDRPARQRALEARLAELGTAGITVCSGPALAALLLDRRFAEARPRIASRAVRRRILFETLKEAPGDFAALFDAAPRQTVGMLLPVLEEAALEEFDPAAVRPPRALEAIVRGRFRSVVTLAAAYRRRLESEWADEASVLRRAIQLDAPRLPWTVVPIDRHVPALTRRLIERLQIHTLPPIPPPAIPIDRIRVLRPRDAAEEVELVAQLLLQSKVKSWRDAVVIADDATAPLLASELQAQGIPVAASWGRALGTTGGWTLVSSWLKILAGPFGPGDVASALLGLDVAKQEGRALRIAKRALKSWICTPEGLRAAADQNDPLDDFLKQVPSGVSISAALDWIRQNVLAPLDRRFFGRATPESGAVRREVRASVELLEELQNLGSVPEILDEALRSSTPVACDPGGAGVEILREAADPGRDVTLIVATGFVRGRYPQPPAARPIISDPERASAGLPAASEELLERRSDLLALLAAGRGDIVFTSPHRHGGEWVEPSLFLDELLAQAPKAWKLTHVSDLGAPVVTAGPPPLRTRRGMLRSVTAGLASSPTLLPAARALAADPVCRDLLDAPRRPSKDFTLDRPASLDGISLSPSTLLYSLGCRYQFFVSTILGVEDCESAGRAEFSALELGSLAHKVLELSKGRPTVEAMPALLDAAVRELYPWALSGQFGLALSSLRHTLAEFIPRYLDILDAVKGVPLTAELPLRDGEGERPRLPLPARPGIPGSIPVGGRIDQPLRLPDGSGLILDFKWGKVVDRIERQAAEGFDTQSPLYSWFLREDGRYPKPVGTLYLSVSKDEAIFRPTRNAAAVTAALKDHATILTDPKIEESEAQLAQRVADLLAAMVAAKPDCSPVPEALWEELVKAQADPCKYCSYDLLCRERKQGKK